MNAILFFLIAIFGMNHSSIHFDNTNFVNDSEVIEMLGEHFVKECNSVELHNTMKAYLANHFNEITHISGHYSQEIDVYYYSVYGSTNSGNKVEFFEVNQDLFNAESYYSFTNLFNWGLCRRGFGSSHPRACPGLDCQIFPQGGCLGIYCEPYEC